MTGREARRQAVTTKATRAAVRAIVEAWPGQTCAAIAARIGIGPPTVMAYLRALQRHGAVRVTGRAWHPVETLAEPPTPDGGPRQGTVWRAIYDWLATQGPQTARDVDAMLREREKHAKSPARALLAAMHRRGYVIRAGDRRWCAVDRRPT